MDMDIQKLKELFDEVSAIPNQEQCYVIGKKEYLDMMEPYRPQNMKRIIIPDEYNFRDTYNERIFIIPIMETHPLKFVVETNKSNIL